MPEIVTGNQVEQKIYLLRGKKIMLSHDLAELYGVTTFNFNKAVKRNPGRFPEDFMFQLTRKEAENLKFQIGISSWGGARRATPYAFTEQGVAMLSSVLRSKRAIRVNIEIMRAFARLREILAANKDSHAGWRNWRGSSTLMTINSKLYLTPSGS
ncbi:MAG TPA: ORF6N domain-containing protein [bacterium]|nr:ORF6N domain-containing protein [bacterium]